MFSFLKQRAKAGLCFLYSSHIPFLEIKIKLARATCTERCLHREESVGGTGKQNYRAVEEDVYQY